MQISVKIKMTEDYYKEFYSEWLKFRSYRKWQPLIAILLIMFSAFVFIFFNSNAFFISLLFTGFGIYELFEYYYTRKKWLNERLASNITNKEISMVFEDDVIRSNGPFTNTELKWNGITKAIETKKGLFLIPENGISIYLQKLSFDSEGQIKLIVDKVNSYKKNESL